AATSALTFSGAVPLESACSAVVTARQAITAMKNVWRILTCRPAPSQLLAGAWRDLELLGDRSGVANRRDVGLGVDHDLLQSRTICRRNLHAVRPRTAREYVPPTQLLIEQRLAIRSRSAQLHTFQPEMNVAAV